MTPDEISKLNALCHQRTGGYKAVLSLNLYDKNMSSGRRVMLNGFNEFLKVSSTNPNDDEYIVAACNALPRLLDEIERLRDAIFHIRDRTMWHPDCAKCGEVYRTAIRVESGGHAGGSEALQGGSVGE